ncbi:mechanosensitive ion channel [Candidatus Dependentiae bacterium]|nr:mechanosensitive ion channel [Candidatus Dependentiae bacterium]
MKIFLNIALISFFLSASSITALGPFGFLVEKDRETPLTFSKQVEKNIEELEKRKNESDDLQNDYKTALDGVQKNALLYKDRLRKVRGVEWEYTNTLVTLVNKTVQVLNEIMQVYQEYKKVLENHIKLLQEYKLDPEFKSKNFHVPQKSIYSIDDFQKINGLVLSAETELKSFEERLKKITFDSEALEKNLLLAQQEYEDKKKEQRLLKTTDTSEEKPDAKNLSIKQKGALLDQEVRLSEYRKDLAEVKIKEADVRAQFVLQNIKIIKIQLEILKNEEERVKQELRIEKKDLETSRKTLEATTTESNRLRDYYSKKIEGLYLLKQSELDEINNLKRRYGLTEQDTDAIQNWMYEPRTIRQWEALIAIGQRYNQSAFEIEIHKDTWLGRIEHEKAKVIEQEVSNSITRTWYNLTTKNSEGFQQEDLVKERKQYQKLKADIEGAISSLMDKRTAATQTLTLNKRLADVLKNYIKLFKDQQTTLFKDKPDIYNALGHTLKDKIALDTEKRGEAITSLIDIYTTTINLLGTSSKKIDTMIEVLNSKAQWKGAPPFWKGLKNFIPDISKFVHYVFFENQLSHSLTSLKNGFFNGITDFSFVFKALLYLLVLFLMYMLIRLYLPPSVAVIERLITPDYGILYVLGNLVSSLLLFIHKHLLGMYLWFIVLLGVRYDLIDKYLGVLFCLISIPLWIYYVYRLIGYLKHINATQGYLFANEAYQKRFFFWLSFLLNVTIVFLFLREAMMLVFPKSATSMILLALNFILLQLSLIFMIGREQLLYFIPRKDGFWNWFYDFLNTYYYPCVGALVFIILMSNPYIGYGPQFFYVITRCVLIFLVISFFVAFHDYIKQVTGSFFFNQDDEGLKERFKYSRTYYGLFIIISFLFFTGVALIIAANIWGYSLGYDEISSWLNKDIYGFESKGTGRYIGVNALDLIKAFFYYGVGGMVSAYVVNKYVLRRMFDLLLVNIGVQSALLTFSRTLIILTAVVIGVQSVGLDGSLFFIFAVLGGLGFAGKEIISDFIGYFVILIQRPVRIGDFVRIDAELTGVVRHLTVRSIVIRKNNSVTLIIPNSLILTRPITNWNYSRTYFAFEDMYLTVMYLSDPSHVKRIILRVLEENPNILKNPAPVVRLHDFIENGFQFMVRGYLSPDKVLDQFDIVSDIRLELVITLRAQGYDLGSPTRLLRVVEDKETSKNVVADQKKA